MSRKRSKTRKAKNELKKQRKMRCNLVGIYDEFRIGGAHSLNFNAADAELVGEYFTEPIYSVHRLSPNEFGATEGGTTSLKIEVYRITDALLTRLDKNYGYYGVRDEENAFDRKIISSPFGRMTIWVFRNIYKASEVIQEGDIIEFAKEELSLKKKDNMKREEAALADSYVAKEKKVFNDLEKIFDEKPKLNT